MSKYIMLTEVTYKGIEPQYRCIGIPIDTIESVSESSTHIPREDKSKVSLVNLSYLRVKETVEEVVGKINELV